LAALAPVAVLDVAPKTRDRGNIAGFLGRPLEAEAPEALDSPRDGGKQRLGAQEPATGRLRRTKGQRREKVQADLSSAGLELGSFLLDLREGALLGMARFHQLEVASRIRQIRGE